MEQGDLTAAIASYNTALRLKPNHPEAHYNSAMPQRAGRLTAAIASYNTAFQLKPHYSTLTTTWALLSTTTATCPQQSPPTTPLFNSSPTTQKLKKTFQWQSF